MEAWIFLTDQAAQELVYGGEVLNEDRVEATSWKIKALGIIWEKSAAMNMDKKNKKNDAEQGMGVEEQARREDARGLFAKAKRAPTGLFKSLIERQRFEGIHPMSVLRGGEMRGQSGALSFLCEANLWRSLAAAYGRCDCMVEGKYKKARVFAFETENLYIWCASEAGDRRTEWFVSDKSAPAQQKLGGNYQFARWEGMGESKLSEIQMFIKDLIVGAAVADKETMEKYAPNVAWVRTAKEELAAMVEADELSSVALLAAASTRKAGL